MHGDVNNGTLHNRPIPVRPEGTAGVLLTFTVRMAASIFRPKRSLAAAPVRRRPPSCAPENQGRHEPAWGGLMWSRDATLPTLHWHPSTLGSACKPLHDLVPSRVTHQYGSMLVSTCVVTLLPCLDPLALIPAPDSPAFLAGSQSGSAGLLHTQAIAASFAMKKSAPISKLTITLCLSGSAGHVICTPSIPPCRVNASQVRIVLGGGVGAVVPQNAMPWTATGR